MYFGLTLWGPSYTQKSSNTGWVHNQFQAISIEIIVNPLKILDVEAVLLGLYHIYSYIYI